MLGIQRIPCKCTRIISSVKFIEVTLVGINIVFIFAICSLITQEKDLIETYGT